jgi:partner of Y14 and mago protein
LIKDDADPPFPSLSPSPSTFSPYPDSVRKERKVRPGFTPQEDVAIFRSVRQQAVDARALPKGHIPGWAPPGAAAQAKKEPQSKSAKKNEKRKEKRKEKREEVVQENWDSDDNEVAGAPPADKVEATDGTTSPSSQGQNSQEKPTERKVAAAESDVDAVADKLDKLTV